MVCLIEQLLSIRDVNKLPPLIKSMYKRSGVKVPIVTKINDEVIFPVKSIIDDGMYIIILNPIRLNKLDDKEYKHVLFREFLKLFYADAKTLNTVNQMFAFLKDFGINIFLGGYSWQKLQQRNPNFAVVVLGSFVITSVTNFIADKIIDRLVTKPTTIKVMNKRYFHKLGCDYEKMSKLYESVFITNQVSLSEEIRFPIKSSLLKYIVNKARWIVSSPCKVVDSFLRIGLRLFGPVPFVLKLQKVAEDCSNV